MIDVCGTFVIVYCPIRIQTTGWCWLKPCLHAATLSVIISIIGQDAYAMKTSRWTWRHQPLYCTFSMSLLLPTYLPASRKWQVSYVHLLTFLKPHASPDICRVGLIHFLAWWHERPLGQAFSLICFRLSSVYHCNLSDTDIALFVNLKTFLAAELTFKGQGVDLERLGHEGPSSPEHISDVSSWFLFGFIWYLCSDMVQIWLEWVLFVQILRLLL